MKKTLSLLALAALAVGATLTTEAKDVVIKPNFPIISNGYSSYYDTESPSYGAQIAPGATLVDTATSGVVIYDEANNISNAPFSIDEGISFTSLTIDLSDVTIQEGDRLVLDFTTVGGGGQFWGQFLQEGYLGDYEGEKGAYDDNVDYLRIKIEGFAEWYQEKGPFEMVAKFLIDYNSAIETTAFYIAEACDYDTAGNPVSEGSVVFFSEDVIDDVRNSEVVPEPTTATLSLLALTGLVARRRRK